MDSSFFNQFVQQFAPGPSLSFRLSLTTNVDAGGTPDEFTFSILDRTGAEIPTTSPLNVLMLIDIDSANPAVQTFGTDVTQIPAGGGPGINIAAPQAVAAIPEPATFAAVVGGLILILARRRARTRH